MFCSSYFKLHIPVMIIRKQFIILYLPILALVVSIFAHGTKYEILQDKIIGIKAMLDTGDPIAHAKVLIFAPEDSKVTHTTNTDSNGVFYFTPDKAGIWTLQVRAKGGHGMRINLTVDESMQLAGNHKGIHSGTTYFQKVIMAICVVWGCIGTALYFRRKEKT